MRTVPTPSSPTTFALPFALPFALLILALLGAGSGACSGAAGGGGDGGGGGGGPGAADVRDRTRDLTAFFEDGMVVGPVGEFPPGAFPATATRAQARALARLNWYRWQVDLPPVDMSAAANRAAEGHCACVNGHTDAYAGGARDPESEAPTWTAPCAGELPRDRVAAHGVVGAAANESIGAAGDAELAVDRWMVGLYDRLAAVHPWTSVCGYDQAGVGEELFNVLDCVRVSGRAAAEPVVYPKNGASEVGTLWGGQDSPAPPPPPGGWPSGPVVSLTWPGAEFSVLSHELFDGDGALVPHTFLDAENDPQLAAWDTVALYADRPLAAGTSHLVVLELEVQGEKRLVDWSFRTRGTAG